MHLANYLMKSLRKRKTNSIRNETVIIMSLTV